MSDFFNTIQTKLLAVTSYENKRMFGAFSFVKDTATFGFVMDDQFYLRTDESTESVYIEACMEKFNPRKMGKGMPYHTVPDFVTNDLEMLEKWVEQAVLTAKKHKKK